MNKTTKATVAATLATVVASCTPTGTTDAGLLGAGLVRPLDQGQIKCPEDIGRSTGHITSIESGH